MIAVQIHNDAPGHFIDYLCHQEPVVTFRLRATRLDIGSIESHHAANHLLKQQPVQL
jgi:hypothetical protein